MDAETPSVSEAFHLCHKLDILMGLEELERLCNLISLPHQWNSLCMLYAEVQILACVLRL